jgi:hypothetical protein
MNTVRRVTASGNLWPEAKKALEGFQAAVKEVRSVDLTSSRAEEIFDKYAFAPNDLLITTQKGFFTWFEFAFGTKAYADISSTRPQGPDLLALSENPDPRAYQALLTQITAHERSIQRYLDQLGPEQFNYKGFKIQDRFHLGPDKMSMVFDAINFLLAVFRKRGVPNLIQEGLQEVILRDTGDAGGLYNSRAKTIELGPTLLTDQVHRLLGNDSWILGSFMHEFGHHIHMNYVTGDAQAFWDGAWDPIHELKGTLDKISQGELERFFALLEKDGFNPTKTAKRLKGADKIKFAYWLRDPGFGEPIITPNQFRLTKRGREIFDVLRDPEGYVQRIYGYSPEEPEFKKRVWKVVEHKKKILGVGYSTGLRIAPEMVRKLKEADPEIDAAINSLYESLGIPSEYGKTNELEDFADTFVLFMTAPEKLSPNALYRMKRTLWLSGFGGKPVSKLAYRVAWLYLQRDTQDLPGLDPA